MNKLSKFVGIGIGFFILFLVITLPAHLVLKQISPPKNVRLSAPTGSIWSGQMPYVVVDGILLKKVKWTFSPLHLFTAKAAVNFKFGNSGKVTELSGKGLAFIGFSGAGVQDAKFFVPAAMAAAKMNNPMLESVGGVIKLDVATAQQGQPYCAELDGKVHWNNASVTAMGGKFELGQLSADISCKAGGLAAKAKGDDQILILDAQAELKGPKQYLFTGFIKAGGDADTKLIQALSFIGAADSQGRYRLHLAKGM